MPNYLDLRRELREAALDYADVRRYKSYRSLEELEALFETLIEAARALLQEEAALGLQQPLLPTAAESPPPTPAETGSRVGGRVDDPRDG